MCSEQKVSVGEALLKEPPPTNGQSAPGKNRSRRRRPSLLTLLSLAFLTVNAGVAVHRSAGDLPATSFVAFSYLDLVALFCCLHWYESTPPDWSARRREQLKAAVWLLTTMLTAAFSYKVAGVMPFLAVQVAVWGMAGATVVGGFYVLFVHREGAKA